MNNIYDSPEKFGLEIVSSADVAGGWEFDMIIVFRRLSDGQLFVTRDSGCSCPTPFENHDIADLTPIRGRADVVFFAREEWGDQEYDGVAKLVTGWQ